MFLRVGTSSLGSGVGPDAVVYPVSLSCSGGRSPAFASADSHTNSGSEINKSVIECDRIQIAGSPTAD